MAFLTTLLATLVLTKQLEVPFLSGPVVDEFGLLTKAERMRVERAILSLNRSGVVEMAVLITSSLQGTDIESYAIEVAEKWRLGSQSKDNGLIFVIAPNERRMRLEVGYGLEGNLTDAFCRNVLDDYVRPLFQERRFVDGLIAAVFLVGKKLNIEEASNDLSADFKKLAMAKTLPAGALILLFVFFLLIAMLASNVLGRNRGMWYGGRRRVFDDWGGSWYGSGFGGRGGFEGDFGGFSGHGGGFGGGGASSSW